MFNEGTAEKVNLTPGESKVLALAWKCFETPPKVNYQRLMELGGYKTKGSATAVYLAARKKFMNGAAAAGASPTSTKKRGKAVANENNDGNDSPAPKTKRARAAKVPKGEDLVGDSDDDETVNGDVKADKDTKNECVGDKLFFGMQAAVKAEPNQNE